MKRQFYDFDETTQLQAIIKFVNIKLAVPKFYLCLKLDTFCQNNKTFYSISILLTAC